MARIGLTEAGKREEKIETTKRLLEMNQSIEMIIKITNLSKEEIEKIKKGDIQ